MDLSRDWLNNQFPGSIINFEDGYRSPQGYDCIRMVVSINELKDIIHTNKRIIKPDAIDQIDEGKSSFLFEKHLEDFLVTNWDRTPLSNDYKIFERDGV